MRINKYLKDRGYSTRRGADELIKKGAVSVNGRTARLGQEVSPTDNIEIRGKSGVREEAIYYIAYNKPIGVLTNKDSASGRDILSTTKFKNTDGDEIKVFPVGRLDKDSHGLILMTNDGRVTDKLLSPRFLHEKEYIVVADKPFNDFFLSKMANGIRIDGSVTRKAQTERLSPNKFSIVLTEGKKRQIRRMCEALHYDVMDLERVRIMNIKLGKLKSGEYRHLNKDERKDLLRLLYIPEKETMLMANVFKKPVVKKVVTSAPLAHGKKLVKSGSKKQNNYRVAKGARPMKSAPRRKSR